MQENWDFKRIVIHKMFNTDYFDSIRRPNNKPPTSSGPMRCTAQRRWYRKAFLFAFPFLLVNGKWPAKDGHDNATFPHYLHQKISIFLLRNKTVLKSILYLADFPFITLMKSKERLFGDVEILRKNYITLIDSIKNSSDSTFALQNLNEMKNGTGHNV